MNGLTFNADIHEYRFGGVVVPSVTQVLASLYDFSSIPLAALEYARQRGVAVHRAVALDIANDLDVDSVQPELAPYLAAWHAFVRDAGLNPGEFGEIEQPLYHPAYRYAGTPDITACLDGKWSVIDLKTAVDHHPAWPLQTAAYKELLNANTPKGQHKIGPRYSLRLREDGTYRLDEHKDLGDWTTFLAFLTTHRFKEQHK